MTCRSKFLSALFLIMIGMLMPASYAATPEENSALDALRKMHQDGLHEAADRQCADFLGKFPNSEHLPEVWLIQARSRIALKRFDDAITVLKESAGRAGQRIDEFDLLQTDALLAKGDWVGAAEVAARFLASHQGSKLRLQAAYIEAFAKHRAGDSSGAVALLNNPEGHFQKEAAARPGDEWSRRGWLLLAEMLLAVGNPAQAESALKRLQNQPLPPDLDWQGRYLMARSLAMTNRWPEALACVTNLWTAATNTVAPELLAAAALLHGETLERLNQPQAARAAYQRALADNVPPDYRRNAFQRLLTVALANEKSADTVQWLESFIAARPGDNLLDLARLTLGELRLGQYRAAKQLPTSGTPEGRNSLSNFLQQARAQFDAVTTNAPASPLVGRAFLGRGWSFWEEGTNHLADMLLSFESATEKLAEPSLLAVARFKLADAQALSGDLAGARSNYWVVATNFANAPDPTNSLCSQALFQAVRTSIDLNDIPGATTASQKLVELDPNSDLAQRAELLLAYALGRQGNPQAARATFDDFSKRFTNSVLLPEVKLAVSQTYEQQNAPQEAIAVLKSWLDTYSAQTNVPPHLIAQAMFDHARLSYRSSPDTNTVTLLANFCARFPDDKHTPLAQYLIGEYYFGQGDYGKAELQFQQRALIQNTNPALSEIAYRARLMAGRAAVARQSYRSARDHFDWIITNGPLHVASSPIPVHIVAEAYLFRGDTFTLETTAGETNALARFGEAINAFSKVAEHWPSNEFAPLAYGRIGECHLQLATQDPKRYDLAADAFRKAIDSAANASVRSQAEFELGVVRQKQAVLRPEQERPALYDQALDHYLRVLYGQNLRPNESPDPYWVKRAGLAAAELAESQKKFEVATGIYRRLLTEIPPLRARLERKIDELVKSVPASPQTNR